MTGLHGLIKAARQGTDAARAQAELGWYPSHPSLTDEFRHGSYRK
jgi:hypothetical protein